MLPADPPPRPRRLLPRLLLSACVLLVGAEIAVRAMDWRAGRDASFYLPPTLFEQGMYLPHPYTGVVLKPGYGREGPYSYHINALGMRGNELSPDKPPGVYRIFCLGGSTTFGTGATADDKTYPAQLERLLNVLADRGRAPEGRRYEVGNCGVSGWTSVENLINLQLRLVEYDPDAILVYDGVNDGRMIQSRGFLPDYSHVRCSLNLERLSDTERFLLGHVRLYARLARGTDYEDQVGALANFLMVKDHQQLHVPSNQWLNEDGLRVFRRNEEHLVAIAREHGIEPVLSTMAVRDRTSHPGLVDFMARCNEVLRELAADAGVPLIDVGAELSDQPRLYDDWVHFNDVGSLRHAQVVAEAALRQGLFGLR